MATLEQVQMFERDGFLVLEGFTDPEECEAMMAECRGLVQDMRPEEHNTVFHGTAGDDGKRQSIKDQYFINSQDKLGFFFEKEALDDKGQLLVPKHLSLNKIGHALHVLCPTFRRCTFSDKMKELVKSLGIQDPVVPQSMYIFKGPQIGGEVMCHQDATYLYTEPPERLVGLWLALEDTTLNNGCLRFVPGSHKQGLMNGFRLIRNPNKEGPVCIYNTTNQPMCEGDYKPVPIKRGSMILIDGLVFHRSYKNTSSQSRNIYTFHVYDAANTTWSDSNWLQPTEAGTFVHMNDVNL